jgi:hypothetical protein
MTQPEFNPEQHDEFVRRRVVQLAKSAARVAIFDDLIDHHLDGACTLDEAVDQYLHDIDRDGAGYEAA